MSETSKRQSTLVNIKRRLHLALALIPGTSMLCLFIAILSPYALTPQGFNWLVGLIAIGIGIVLAYSAAMFVDAALKNFTEKEK